MKPQYLQIKRTSRVWLHLCLLLTWVFVGASLRLTNLAAKPPWNDEFATVVFSLGNSFRTVPIDRAIALDTLLQPLQPNANAGVRDVIRHLMTESTHPPIYFVLTHLWMKLFPTPDIASFWVARSLSVVFGIISIPAMFGFGYLAFRSLSVGQIAAAMMAVSPYGVYQAQEARHYTLAILLIIASLCCLVTALRNLQRSSFLPVWVGFIWVLSNCLGVAVHYFFTLTLVAETLVLFSFWLRDQNKYKSSRSSWRRVYAVFIATAFGVFAWIPVWQSVPDNQVTQWIFDSHSLSDAPGVIARFVAWIITMISLLPIEGTNQTVMLISGTILIVFFVWVWRIFNQGLKLQRLSLQQDKQGLISYILAAIALLFGITFVFNADLTIAARYQFFYFPVVLLLLASNLSIYWNIQELLLQGKLSGNLRMQTLLYSIKPQGKKVVVFILLMGLIGSFTVVYNFAYQKPDRPDLLIPMIQESQVPILIATTHFTHEQIGEMMGLGLELKRRYQTFQNTHAKNLLFLLAHLNSSSDSIQTLEQIVATLPKPLDLWVVNFFPTPEPEIKDCSLDTQVRPKMNGYKHRLYHCV